MRAFVALEVTTRVQDLIDAALDPLRSTHPELSWVPSTRWHLTLAFLGEVSQGSVDRLDRRLAGIAGRSGALRLEVGSLGRFGQRVLYLNVLDRTGELPKLAARVASAARHSGINIDSSRFRPHVSLGRARQPADLRQIVDAADVLPSGHWDVADLRLIRSHLGPRPRYEVMHSYPLGTARD